MERLLLPQPTGFELEQYNDIFSNIYNIGDIVYTYGRESETPWNREMRLQNSIASVTLVEQEGRASIIDTVTLTLYRDRIGREPLEDNQIVAIIKLCQATGEVSYFLNPDLPEIINPLAYLHQTSTSLAEAYLDVSLNRAAEMQDEEGDNNLEEFGFGEDDTLLVPTNRKNSSNQEESSLPKQLKDKEIAKEEDTFRRLALITLKMFLYRIRKKNFTQDAGIYQRAWETDLEPLLRKAVESGFPSAERGLPGATFFSRYKEMENISLEDAQARILEHIHTIVEEHVCDIKAKKLANKLYGIAVKKTNMQPVLNGWPMVAEGFGAFLVQNSTPESFAAIGLESVSFETYQGRVFQELKRIYTVKAKTAEKGKQNIQQEQGSQELGLDQEE